MELTGRLVAAPDDFIRREFLEPQFRHEAAHLLRWYVLIEKALLREYRRLGVLSAPQVSRLAGALDTLTPEELATGAGAALSDMALAMETRVAEALPEPVPAWHVDRSRNDLQACAQLLYGREQVSEIAAMLGQLAEVAHERAARDVTSPMPGYTHLQPAQIITPGFYLSAVVEHALRVSSKLLGTYDQINFSPLGAGPMAGQELGWDRNWLAQAVGCAGPAPHALAAVASRDWLLDVAADIASAGVGFSRFLTDLMAWSSGAYGLVELPDELAGISAAMPQKKNYPLLERLRGRTGHLTAFYVDFATGQREHAVQQHGGGLQGGGRAREHDVRRGPLRTRRIHPCRRQAPVAHRQDACCLRRGSLRWLQPGQRADPAGRRAVADRSGHRRQVRRRRDGRRRRPHRSQQPGSTGLGRERRRLSAGRPRILPDELREPGRPTAREGVGRLDEPRLRGGAAG